MKAHMTNAAYGVLDYAAYPFGMLVVAPIVLRHLGVAEYGMWTVATAAVSTGGIVASGFGDANIQHVAALRGSGDRHAVGSAVRCMIGINMALGTVLALAGLLAAPAAARHVAGADGALARECLVSLRIASVLMLVRALESVTISTQRAFERYGAAVRISIGVRLLTLVSAALLALAGHGTAAIMEATAIFWVVGTAAQFVRLRQFLGVVCFWPEFDRKTARALFGTGTYSWLQTVAGVVFGQVDRLLLGVSLGAVAVASYALCVQMAQPIFGLAASGLHFLFPYLSGRVGSIAPAELRLTLRRAFLCNVLLVGGGTAALLGFGNAMLQAWAGPAVAQTAAPIFSLIVIGSALQGLGVTGTYALMAMRHFRTVAWVGIGGGVAMLLAMWRLMPVDGVHGLALARLGYGLFSLLLYVPLLRGLAVGAATREATVGHGSLEEVPQR